MQIVYTGQDNANALLCKQAALVKSLFSMRGVSLVTGFAPGALPRLNYV